MFDNRCSWTHLNWDGGASEAVLKLVTKPLPLDNHIRRHHCWKLFFCVTLKRERQQNKYSGGWYCYPVVVLCIYREIYVTCTCLHESGAVFFVLTMVLSVFCFAATVHEPLFVSRLLPPADLSSALSVLFLVFLNQFIGALTIVLNFPH